MDLRLTVMMLTDIELIAGSKTGDTGVKNAMMKALQEVVSKAGANMGEASKNALLGLIDDDASNKTGKLIVTRLRIVLILNRCCGYDKCETAWCSCEGSPAGDSNSAYQVRYPR